MFLTQIIFYGNKQDSYVGHVTSYFLIEIANLNI